MSVVKIFRAHRLELPSSMRPELPMIIASRMAHAHATVGSHQSHCVGQELVLIVSKMIGEIVLG